MLWVEKLFPPLQQDSCPGLQRPQIPVTFSRVLVEPFGGDFLHFLCPLGCFGGWERAGKGGRQSRPSRGVKFLMGKQVRAAGSPGEGDRKDEGRERGGGGGGEKAAAKEKTQTPKAEPGLKSRGGECVCGGVFYEGIVKCGSLFPLCRGEEGPPLDLIVISIN